MSGGGGEAASGCRHMRVGVLVVFVIIFLLGVGIYVAPIWNFSTMGAVECREVARISGPTGLDIVVLDTSGGATTGFSYAVDIVESGLRANRREAVAILGDVTEVKAAWNRSSAAICADNPTIWHYQNFYSVRVGDNFQRDNVLLRSLLECEEN